MDQLPYPLLLARITSGKMTLTLEWIIFSINTMKFLFAFKASYQSSYLSNSHHRFNSTDNEGNTKNSRWAWWASQCHTNAWPTVQTQLAVTPDRFIFFFTRLFLKVEFLTSHLLAIMKKTETANVGEDLKRNKEKIKKEDLKREKR